jgi:hypothetical protein
VIGRASLLAAALLTGAASPTRLIPLTLVEPLLPPKHLSAAPLAPPPSAFTPAPMPDIDLQAGGTPGPATVEVTPNLFNQPRTYQGEGYTPNSTVEGEYARRIRPTPGVNLSVPLN